jgi:hypothetical protein
VNIKAITFSSSELNFVKMAEYIYLQPSEKIKSSCLINFLKSANILSKDHPNSNLPAGDCEEFVRETEKWFYDRLGVAEEGVDKNCMIDELKSRKFMEFIMLKNVYEMSDSMSKEEKEVKVKEADEKSTAIYREARRLCFARKLFDEIFSSKSEDDDVTRYCVRKHVAENNLMEAKLGKIVLNPTNIDISKVNCEKVFAKDTKIFEDEMRSDFKIFEGDCIIRECREGKLLNEILKVSVLSELNISEKEKEKAKDEFVDKAVKVQEKMFQCLKQPEKKAGCVLM